MKLAVVLVHYQTPELAVRSCEALAGTVDRDVEILLVNNSGDEEALSSLAPRVRLLEPGENLGYAGGANLGVRSTDAEAVVVMNPDVLVRPGCVERLQAALQAGSAVAGPLFAWDEEERFLLPPTERRTRRDELLRVVAERSRRVARHARRRWRRHARKIWGDQGKRTAARLPFYELSGALLAIRRDAFETVQGFDEGYRLYFEETDFLERLRRRGLPAVFCGDARAVHLYARSTVGEPRSAGWFETSRRRFFRRFYGAAFTRFLELVASGWKPSRKEERATMEDLPKSGWIEVSVSPLGYPAALSHAESWPRVESWPRAESFLPAGTYFLRAVDDGGRERGFRRVVVSS